jgi:hypothetical protein
MSKWIKACMWVNWLQDRSIKRWSHPTNSRSDSNVEKNDWNGKKWLLTYCKTTYLNMNRAWKKVWMPKPRIYFMLMSISGIKVPIINFFLQNNRPTFLHFEIFIAVHSSWKTKFLAGQVEFVPWQCTLPYHIFSTEILDQKNKFKSCDIHYIHLIQAYATSWVPKIKNLLQRVISWMLLLIFKWDNSTERTFGTWLPVRNKHWNVFSVPATTVLK